MSRLLSIATLACVVGLCGVGTDMSFAMAAGMVAERHVVGDGSGNSPAGEVHLFSNNKNEKLVESTVRRKEKKSGDGVGAGYPILPHIEDMKDEDEEEDMPPTLKSSPSSSSHLSSSASASSARAPLRSLPLLNINASTLTLSGVSAGAAMAIQFQIAFSRIVKAVGTIAGVPYMCAQLGHAVTALNCMKYPYQIESSHLLTYISTYAATGLIDDPTYLRGQMSMVFSGAADSVVKQGTVRIVDEMYASLGVKRRYQYYNHSAEHAWVTHTFGAKCSHLGAPYINNCGHDFSGEFLTKAFEFIGHAAPLTPRSAANPSNLFKFSQAAHGASALISMDSIAYVYIPTACQGGLVTCHLHVNFHGCNQQRTAFSGLEEDLYVSNAGLNEWAEANNIVVLYPQTIASNVVPMNPQGCFDWWGYTNVLFAQRGGVQMRVIREMIRAIGGF